MSRRYDAASKSSKNTTFVGIAVGTWRSWTDVNNNSSVFPCSRYLVIDRTQNFLRNKIKNFAARFELLYGRKWLLLKNGLAILFYIWPILWFRRGQPKYRISIFGRLQVASIVPYIFSRIKAVLLALV